MLTVRYYGGGRARGSLEVSAVVAGRDRRTRRYCRRRLRRSPRRLRPSRRRGDLREVLVGRGASNPPVSVLDERQLKTVRGRSRRSWDPSRGDAGAVEIDATANPPSGRDGDSSGSKRPRLLRRKRTTYRSGFVHSEPPDEDTATLDASFSFRPTQPGPNTTIWFEAATTASCSVTHYRWDVDATVQRR